VTEPNDSRRGMLGELGCDDIMAGRLGRQEPARDRRQHGARGRVSFSVCSRGRTAASENEGQWPTDRLVTFDRPKGLEVGRAAARDGVARRARPSSSGPIALLVSSSSVRRRRCSRR
jgi:hypothetical protein